MKQDSVRIMSTGFLVHALRACRDLRNGEPILKRIHKALAVRQKEEKNAMNHIEQSLIAIYLWPSMAKPESIHSMSIRPSASRRASSRILKLLK